MDPHATHGRRIQLYAKCMKPKYTEGSGQPGELRIHQDPTLAQIFAELPAAIAAPSCSTRPVGRPRLKRPFNAQRKAYCVGSAAAQHALARSTWHKDRQGQDQGPKAGAGGRGKS